MATHSSVLAWRFLEEPGGLQSMGSQRVGHNLATNAYLLNIYIYRPGMRQVKCLKSCLIYCKCSTISYTFIIKFQCIIK